MGQNVTNSYNRMKHLFRATDKIIMVLALLGDIALEAHIRGYGSGWTRAFASNLEIGDGAFRKAVSRLLATDDIDKVVNDKGVVSYRLSAKGQTRFQRDFPLSKLSQKPWDGLWRVIIFDVEEASKRKRNHLRQKLVSLGFGRFQKSVYLTPLNILADLKDYLTSEGLYGRAVVFEAKEVLGIDSKAIADWTWKLTSLNAGYLDLIEQEKDLKDTDLVEEEKDLRSKFFTLLAKDPFLPKELLPPDWLRERARKAVLRI